jgi:hypothetical protein
MRQATSIVFALGLISPAFVPAQAADLKIKAKPEVSVANAHGHARAIRRDDPAPQRICDWVGPGGRASYRCNLG